MAVPLMAIPPVTPSPGASGDVSVAVAATGEGGGGTVTARKAGGLRDVALEVDPKAVGVKAALQHLAKAINIAFQTDYGENYLESVYQAAIVRRGEILVVHKEYFGFRENWFGSFGMLLRSMQLTFDGPDPASPEGQRRIVEKGPASIRGLLNLSPASSTWSPNTRTASPLTSSRCSTGSKPRGSSSAGTATSGRSRPPRSASISGSSRSAEAHARRDCIPPSRGSGCHPPPEFARGE